MFLLLLWALLALIIVSILYYIYTVYRDAKHFKDLGVFYLGNGMLDLLKFLFSSKHFTDSLLSDYEKVKNAKHKFAAGMEFGSIYYFIVDLDLAKKILVKDFDHFVDRRKFGSDTGKSHSNRIFGKMLIALEGDKWKALRSKMSPTFTTGKIRRMFEILDKSGQNMVHYLEQEISRSSGVLDMQEAYSKYAMDVIASVAFGLDSKAFEQREPSTFEKMGAMIQFKFTGWAMIKFIITMISPKLADSLGISLINSEPIEFFSSVIKSAIKYREESKEEKRNDFLQLMLEARAGQLKTDDGGELTEYEKDAVILPKGQEIISKVQVDLEDDDIVAQSILFILGGYDTTQGLLLFSAYNLAVYPDIQERVFQEVKKSWEENDEKLTYDSVNAMEYLDMFISETLRYYPPAIAGERMCTKPYKIPDSNVTIEKGQIVNIPIYGIHRSAEHYPEPEKFDPERFSPENRSKIHPCAFIPFGAGPRNCIAMRLALVEAKMAVAHLVLNFVFEPSEKTPIPMKYTKEGALKPDGGLWLKLHSRNQ